MLKTKFGTAKVDKHGYYTITSKKEGNYTKRLHRLIFEDFYKIKLPEHIIIHHNDENKLNNEIWNLIPMTRAEHNRIHNAKEHSLEMQLNISKSKNSTGYFRVHKHKNKGVSQGFVWEYRYYENGKQKGIVSVSIDKLRKKVLSKGLEWIVIDEKEVEVNG